MTDGPGVADDLQLKVEFLADPGAYPDPTSRVKTVETHMAWVFLTAHHAYKLKKPVRFDFLDYSTLDARRASCEAEVRLNRRLAPDIYLGTQRLSVMPDGEMTLGAAERTVDWLVKMRRLPRHRMLDEVVQRGSVEEADLVAVGRLLGDFYSAADRVRLTLEEHRERLRTGVEESLQEIARPEFDMDRERIDAVAAAQRRFLDDAEGLLAGRLREGRIVEGHGDLRPQHVCLLDPPVVIDCVEFNRDFRIVDALDDLCFLWLECELLDAPEVGGRILDAYAYVTGDSPPESLTRFYRSARACLRAKLCLWHLEDEDVATEEHAGWVKRARDYLGTAVGHAERIGG